jgi:hypothetical protein
MRCSVAVMLGLLLAPGASRAPQPTEAGRLTVIYFVRHAEVDPPQATFPLSAAGRRKAADLARAVGEVTLTHVFSSHTTRARQMVEPAAQARQLPVRQLPQPGIQPDSTVVSDRTSSGAAIGPLIRALRELPAGSRALVGLNSDNVYAVLHGLGVPEGTAEQPCLSGRTCVPCLTNACASPRYDQLWRSSSGESRRARHFSSCGTVPPASRDMRDRMFSDGVFLRMSAPCSLRTMPAAVLSAAATGG